MPHNGTIDYGQEIPVVIPDTPVISVVHLEEVSFAKAVRSDTTVRNVELIHLDPVPIVIPEDVVIDVEIIVDGILDVEIVTYTPSLSDTDLIQLDLYNAYGNAYDARLVLYALKKLVNTDLYNGTNGIVV